MFESYDNEPILLINQESLEAKEKANNLPDDCSNGPLL